MCGMKKRSYVLKYSKMGFKKRKKEKEKIIKQKQKKVKNCSSYPIYIIDAILKSCPNGTFMKTESDDSF